jgi:hypothetical protein
MIPNLQRQLELQRKESEAQRAVLVDQLEQRRKDAERQRKDAEQQQKELVRLLTRQSEQIKELLEKG